MRLDWAAEARKATAMAISHSQGYFSTLSSSSDDESATVASTPWTTVDSDAATPLMPNSVKGDTNNETRDLAFWDQAFS